MSGGIGVSGVSRSPNGNRYAITKDSDPRVAVGYVEEVGAVMAARDWHDEPVLVGSKRHAAMIAAVKAYKAWAEKS